jgi:hypothetical protein
MQQRVADLINRTREEPFHLLGSPPEDAVQNLVVESLTSLGRDGDDPFVGHNPRHTQKALVAFLCRPWFRRSWIIQEFIVSQEVELVCGKERCDYGSFLPAFGYAFEQSKVSWASAIEASQKKEFHLGLSQMLKIFERRNDMHNKEHRLQLIMLLREYRTSLATLAQDKIYSLIGISKDYADLNPDYQISKQDLYIYRLRNISLSMAMVNTF